MSHAAANPTEDELLALEIQRKERIANQFLDACLRKPVADVAPMYKSLARDWHLLGQRPPSAMDGRHSPQAFAMLEALDMIPEEDSFDLSDLELRKLIIDKLRGVVARKFTSRRWTP